MKIEYFLVVFSIFLSSNLGFMVFPGKKRRPNKRASIIALVSATLVFLGIDLFAIGWFYEFNPLYVSGIGIGKMPIEEILFFPVVGWGILLLHVNLTNKIIENNWISRGIILILVLLCIKFGWWYTVTVLGVLLVIRRFPIYTLVLTIILTTIFNWYLTARPIVIYEMSTRTGLQIGPIPIEDYLFGIGFVLLVVLLYDQLVAAGTDSNNFFRKIGGV